MVQSNKNFNLLYLIFYFPHDFTNIQKKEEPVKEMIEVSGTIDRVITYTYFDSAPLLVFMLKEYNKTFYLKYVWPKQALTKENDNVTFKVEQGMPTNKNHVNEMVEVEQNSFRNKNLSY